VYRAVVVKPFAHGACFYIKDRLYMSQKLFTLNASRELFKHKRHRSQKLERCSVILTCPSPKLLLECDPTE
jgi:hypothetical protein